MPPTALAGPNVDRWSQLFRSFERYRTTWWSTASTATITQYDVSGVPPSYQNTFGSRKFAELRSSTGLAAYLVHV